MGKLRNWLHKRKSPPPGNRHTFLDRDSHSFPGNLVEIWNEQRKVQGTEEGTQTGSTDAKLSTQNASDKTKVALDAQPPPTSSAPKGGSSKADYVFTPFRTSNTSKAMALHATSFNQVQQQSHKKQASTLIRTETDLISSLGTDLVFYLLDFLDPVSIFHLKLINKSLYGTISINHFNPDLVGDIKKNSSQWHQFAASSKFIVKPAPDSQLSDEEIKALHAKRKKREEQAIGIDVMICGFCCDYLFQVPGISSKDICRCGQGCVSPTGQYANWLSTNANRSSGKRTSKNKRKELPKKERLGKENIEAKEEIQKLLKPGEDVDNTSDISPAGLTLAMGGYSNIWVCALCLRDKIPSPGADPTDLCACNPLSYSSSGQDPLQITSSEVPLVTTPVKKRISMFSALKAATLSPPPVKRKTCPSCHQFSEITPGVTLMSEMCRCSTGPLPLNEHQTLDVSSSTKSARNKCNTCHLFSEITPGVTLVSEMCRCPNGPLTITPPILPSTPIISNPPISGKPPTSISIPNSNRPTFNAIRIPICPSCRLYLPQKMTQTPRSVWCHCPIDTTPTPSSKISMERETCPTCHRFSNITPGITLVVEMCHCPGGPLIVKRPVRYAYRSDSALSRG